jgi:hypothetical protein
MIQMTGLDHVVLNVSDVDRSLHNLIELRTYAPPPSETAGVP